MIKALIISILSLPCAADANPYFRPLNPSHPQFITGALLDPAGLGNSEATALLPLVTHSPTDGCLLPSIVCEDWTPLAVGGSMNAGKMTLDVAPLANVLPWMQSAGKALVPHGWSLLRELVDYNAANDAVSFSAGPVWEYKQATNKGYFRVFTGLSLKF